MINNIFDKIKEKIEDKIEEIKNEKEKKERLKEEQIRKEEEKRRLNTPIIEAVEDLGYVDTKVLEDDNYEYWSSLGNYKYCNREEEQYRQVNSIIYPNRFTIELVQTGIVIGDKVYEDIYDECHEHDSIYDEENIEISRNEMVLQRKEFFQNSHYILNSDSEEILLRGINILEQSYYASYIISLLKDYDIFSRNVCARLNYFLHNEYLKRYEEFKKSNSHEEAKKRASDSVVNAKNILRERNEIYNKRYSIYQENQERQNKIEEENKKDLEDNYMSL